MQEIAQENKRLVVPLNTATEEVNNLKLSLKDYNKNKIKKINSINRLTQINERINTLKVEHSELSTKYDDVSKERNTLYEQFDTTVNKSDKLGIFNREESRFKEYCS